MSRGGVSTVTANLMAASTTYIRYVSLVSVTGDSSVLKHHKESLRILNCLESTWTQSKVPAGCLKQFSEICKSQKGSIDRVNERLQRSKVSRGHTERHGMSHRHYKTQNERLQRSKVSRGQTERHGMSHRHYKTQKERLQGSKGLQRSKGPYYVTNKRYVPGYHAYEYDRLLQVMEKAVMAFLRA